jgi:hypothetical protein
MDIAMHPKIIFDLSVVRFIFSPPWLSAITSDSVGCKPPSRKATRARIQLEIELLHQIVAAHVDAHLVRIESNRATI